MELEVHKGPIAYIPLKGRLHSAGMKVASQPTASTIEKTSKTNLEFAKIRPKSRHEPDVSQSLSLFVFHVSQWFCEVSA